MPRPKNEDGYQSKDHRAGCASRHKKDGKRPACNCEGVKHRGEKTSTPLAPSVSPSPTPAPTTAAAGGASASANDALITAVDAFVTKYAAVDEPPAAAIAVADMDNTKDIDNTPAPGEEAATTAMANLRAIGGWLSQMSTYYQSIGQADAANTTAQGAEGLAAVETTIKNLVDQLDDLRMRLAPLEALNETLAQAAQEAQSAARAANLGAGALADALTYLPPVRQLAAQLIEDRDRLLRATCMSDTDWMAKDGVYFPKRPAEMLPAELGPRLTKAVEDVIGKPAAK